jgi:hypothetical protein
VGQTRSYEVELHILSASFFFCFQTVETGALPAVRDREIGTSVSNTSKRDIIFHFTTRGGKQVSSYFDRGTGSKPARLTSGSLQAEVSLIV